MSYDEGEASEDGLTPEDAFGLLGNEHRARILHTLGDAQGTEGPRPAMSFSELYSAADADIATSQFNYHLQKLVGPFIDKTDDGYRLRYEGVNLYRTIIAGTYTKDSRSIEPFEVGVNCYYCSAAIEATYQDRRVTIACSECDRQYSDTTMPPSLIEADEAALLSRIDQYIRHRILAFSKGVCSICANRLSTRFLSSEELSAPGSDQLDLFVHRSCDHCGAQQYMSVGLSLLYNSQLIAFFEERGLDVTMTPIWELEFAMTDRFIDIRSTEPWKVALTVQRDGDELQFVVNDDLSVIEQSSPRPESQ